MSTIECLICGRKLRALGPHIKFHNITGKEYKKKFGVKLLVSEDVSKLIGSRPYGRPWIYGRTKETEPRLKIMGEKISRANKGRLVWNDGLSSDPNSPNYDPRLEQGVKTRKENDPDNLVAQRIVQIRRDRYGSAMCRDPEARSKNISKALKNGGIKKAIETRKINDPDGKSYQKTWPTRRERYPPSGYKDYDALCERMTILNNTRKTNKWTSKSPEEKRQLLVNSIFKKGKKPNISETKLMVMLDPLGFAYNDKTLEFIYNDKITNHIPDFIHASLPLLIEYDGEGGHRPDLVPYLPKNKEQLDDQRDADYRAAGKDVLRLLPYDLKLGKEHIQNKVKAWMWKHSIKSLSG